MNHSHRFIRSPRDTGSSHFAICHFPILLAVLLSLPGCDRSTAATSPQGAASGQAAVERVTAGTPQRKDLKLQTAQPAWIEAYETTPRFPRISGYVQEVLVDIGDPVKENDPLLRLSVPEMQDDVQQKLALVAQAEAEIGQGVAQVEAAKADVESARSHVAQVQAGILRANAECDYCQTEYERIDALAKSRSATQELVTAALNKSRSAQAAKQEAEAAVDAAQAALHESEAGVQNAEADLAAARARIKVAGANLAYAQTMLAYAEIKAPFDGVVTQRNVDTGHYVQPSAGGGRPLLVVARTDQVRVFIDVPEIEAGYVDSGESGDVATLRVQALGGREFSRPVTRTSWALDPANQSLRVEVDLPNDDGKLRPGMYATATILLEERKDALTLPATAIVRDGANTLCCVVRDGKIVRTAIQLGLRAGDDVEVLSGLEPSQVVVLLRADALKDGQPVEVIEPEQKK